MGREDGAALASLLGHGRGGQTQHSLGNRLWIGLELSKNDMYVFDWLEKEANFLFVDRQAMEYWHQSGVPKEKLLMGLAAYGRSWKLGWGPKGK